MTQVGAGASDHRSCGITSVWLEWWILDPVELFLTARFMIRSEDEDAWCVEEMHDIAMHPLPLSLLLNVLLHAECLWCMHEDKRGKDIHRTRDE
jgi:hypothetical protein